MASDEFQSADDEAQLVPNPYGIMSGQDEKHCEYIVGFFYITSNGWYDSPKVILVLLTGIE